MSGVHHRRVGWTYGPRPRGVCTGCMVAAVNDLPDTYPDLGDYCATYPEDC